MIPLNEYRSHPYVNVSTLKTLNNPRWIKWKIDNPDAEDEEKTHLRIGGAVDTLLTNREDFNSLYTVEKEGRPGGMMGIFIDKLPLYLDEKSDKYEYHEAYIESGYSIPIDIVIKRLWETDKYKNYFMSRKRAQGKTIISQKDKEVVNYCTEQIWNNPYVRQYFLNTDPNIRIIHQAIILFEYNDVMCKGALDGILIDMKNKIIRPFDLKTTFNVNEFPRMFFKLKYYLQGSFYVEGLKKVLQGDEFTNYYNLPNEIKNYHIENMRFIAVEKERGLVSSPAHIFTTTDEIHQLGIKGGVYKERYYKGFEDYLEDWKYHTYHDMWEYSREYIQNKGEFNLE